MGLENLSLEANQAVTLDTGRKTELIRIRVKGGKRKTGPVIRVMC